jgi:uncharacterized protein with NRDE domain
MCIILFAYDMHPRYPLVLLANRDEFYDRATAPAAMWDDADDIYAGRDLVAGGTWLGISKASGRLAAVTNYREPNAGKGQISRGRLVTDFLRNNVPAAEYLVEVEVRRNDYSGFNLLAGEFNRDRCELLYYSNRGSDGIARLGPGVYGLSNHVLDTPWPKVRNGTERLGQLIGLPDLDVQLLFDLLADDSPADDAELPDTGVGYEVEKALSSIFIQTPNYGTRCSSVITVSSKLEMSFEERVFV